MDPLQRKVRAVRRRLTWLRFVSITLVSLFWLSTLAAATLIAARLVMPIDDEALWQRWTWWAVAARLRASSRRGKRRS